MQLLKYEFMDVPDDSFNGLLKKLVRNIRYYRDQPIEEYQQAMPSLISIETSLNHMQELMDLEKGEFIKEITKELEAEDVIEENLTEEIQRSLNAVLEERATDLGTIQYIFQNRQAVYWVELFGYNTGEALNDDFRIIKEVFRSVCYKLGVIFIDNTITE
jgi:DNA-binding transcriptional MerR regulator